MRKQIECKITVLVEESDLPKVQAALNKYVFDGEGVIGLDKDLTRGDMIKTAATKNFLKPKK